MKTHCYFQEAKPELCSKCGHNVLKSFFCCKSQVSWSVVFSGESLRIEFLFELCLSVQDDGSVSWPACFADWIPSCEVCRFTYRNWREIKSFRQTESAEGHFSHWHFKTKTKNSKFTKKQRWSVCRIFTNFDFGETLLINFLRDGNNFKFEVPTEVTLKNPPQVTPWMLGQNAFGSPGTSAQTPPLVFFL